MSFEKDGLKIPVVISCDAGGTMTDVIVMDMHGNFSVGKASTTPHDESVGFWASMKDAFGYWDIELDREAKENLSRTEIAIYSGTAVVNALLQRKGRKIGLLVNKGFEDMLITERGMQAWAGFSYADRFHKVTHYHNEPLVPRKRVKGITGRIDMFGDEVIPLYEDEVRSAVKALLNEDVENICISFLWSFLNPSHESRAVEIAKEVMREAGIEVTVYASSKVAPIFMEHSRTNCTVIQGYCSDIVQESLRNIEKKMIDNGFRRRLHTITAAGGLVDIRYPRMVESVVSGPIGGLMGAKYLAAEANLGDYVLATDLGGTTFDLGIISGGIPFSDREVHVARHILNLPILTMDNIGAGLGMYLSVDKERKRVQLGPHSAGADPGPVCYDMGNEVPTLADAHLILGHLNPDCYLGGQIKLNVDKARYCFEEQIAKPLGMPLLKAADSVRALLNARLRDSIYSILRSRGFHPGDFILVSYGGAGPMELAFYTHGMGFKGAFTVPWAAAFSAFGLVSDYAHRYQKSTMLIVPPGGNADQKMQVGQALNGLWEELENKAKAEFAAVGKSWENVSLQPLVYLRYGGQLYDLETPSPVNRVNSAEDFDQIIKAFEKLYEKAYTSVAKHPEAGYMILNVGLVVSVELHKPKIEVLPLEGKEPNKSAFKMDREIFLRGESHMAKIYDMELIRPGNTVSGPTIFESTNTTLIVPKGKRARMDARRFIWIEDER